LSFGATQRHWDRHLLCCFALSKTGKTKIYFVLQIMTIVLRHKIITVLHNKVIQMVKRILDSVLSTSVPFNKTVRRSLNIVGILKHN
jgi:hypothetical protein